jgi:hypothetical protein
MPALDISRRFVVRPSIANGPRWGPLFLLYIEGRPPIYYRQGWRTPNDNYPYSPYGLVIGYAHTETNEEEDGCKVVIARLIPLALQREITSWVALIVAGPIVYCV